MRLHELAKELGADSKRMLAIAKELNLGVKSHSSNIPKGAEGILRAAWAEELEEMEEAEKAAADKAKAEQEAAAGDAKAADGGGALEVRAETGAPAVTINVKSSDEVAAEQAAVVAERAAREAAEAAETAAREAAEAAAAAASAAAVVEEVAAEAPPAAADAPAAAAPVEVVGAAPAAPVEAGAATVPPDEATADGEEPKRIQVTIGGKQALPADTEEEQPPAEGEATETKIEEPQKRRGARILGRIELPKQAPRTRSSPSEYDPLDPTRPAPPRRGKAAAGPGTGTGTGTREGEAAKTSAKKGGGKGKPEWVFDPEDNPAMSALRLGHFSGGRRPPVRRPPVRRGSMPGRRKRRGERPTHPVSVRPPIGVRELSEQLGVRTREILQHFPGVFDPRDKNAVLLEEHLVELAVNMSREITVLEAETEEGRLLVAEQARAAAMAGDLEPRPPVVAVMGHVDHGKTTLLDALRKTNVAGKEAGGITQRTSAYQVSTAKGAKVTFLDTPGHKAFTEMRARGAQITDVAVLVVAADDGVMEQTIEAIEHANAAGVPVVVAVNKMDLPGANPQMVRQQLASAGILVEDYGGEVGIVECSAHSGLGLEELVERLALETEVLELTGDPQIPAVGVVVDSRKDRDMGIVATVVVKNGTLRAKDEVLAGTSVGRVRYMLDDMGKRVKEAGPSTPVQVFGLEDPPEAGAHLLAVGDLNKARSVVRDRKEANREDIVAASDAVTLENLFETIEAQKTTELNVILKVDAQGSLEVLRRTIEDLAHPEVRFKVIRAGVGGITEDDIVLADASSAVVIGFGVVADAKARREVQRTGVEVKLYTIIYEMTEELEKALEGELAPETREDITGHAVVREVFKSSRFGNIAGCYVTDGFMRRDSAARLVRDGAVIYQGRIDSLRRFKEDAKEVKENYECGLHLLNYEDIKPEDVVETFELTEVKRTLSSPALTTK